MGYTYTGLENTFIGVCPAGRERSYGGMPKAGRCPKYCFFLIYARILAEKSIYLFF